MASKQKDSPKTVTLVSDAGTKITVAEGLEVRGFSAPKATTKKSSDS